MTQNKEDGVKVLANVTKAPGGSGGYPTLGARFPTDCAGDVYSLGEIVAITPPDIVSPSQPKLGFVAVCWCEVSHGLR